MNVCCGGIVGMGESRGDRVGMIAALATLPVHPESVPINLLVRVAGTPLAEAPPLDAIEFVRTIAVARITMPASMVRLSAGREAMSDETAGAVLPRRRQFDLLRRETADDAQSRPRPRSSADGSARPRAKP